MNEMGLHDMSDDTDIDPDRFEQPRHSWDELTFTIELTPEEYQMVVAEKQRRGIMI